MSGTFYADETTADALEAWSEARRDADIEMAEWAETGRAVDAARKAGRCTHGSTVGYLPPGKEYYEEQKGLKPGESRCTSGCGQVFKSDDDWDLAVSEALYG